MNNFSEVKLLFEDRFEFLDKITLEKIYNQEKNFEEVKIQYYSNKEILSIELLVNIGQKRVLIKKVQFFEGKNSKESRNILDEDYEYTGGTVIELMEEFGESYFF